MNKQDLIGLTAARTNLTQRDVTAVLDALLETVVDSVADGHRVTLVGFGTWQAVQRKERQARNPQNNEVITVPTRMAVTFKVGKRFKSAVNGGLRFGDQLPECEFEEA